MHGQPFASLETELIQRRRRLAAAAHRVGGPALNRLIDEVDLALERIDRGTFGECEACDGTVEDERLVADPLTRVCLSCLTPEEQRALEHDLELAATIQHRLLPCSTASHAGWEFGHHFEPLGPVSGDHIDVIPPDRPDGDVYFLFGDSSGKGVAASMLSAQLHAVFRSLIGLGLPMTEILSRANHLVVSSTPANPYATLVFGRLSADGELELANAGHLPPLLRTADGVRNLHASGLPLGLFASAEYATETFRLVPGDLLFLYTDGLTESENGSREEFGPARLAGLLGTAAPTLTPQQAIRSSLRDLTAFRRGQASNDDLTLMAIRRSAPAGRARDGVTAAKRRTARAV